MNTTVNIAEFISTCRPCSDLTSIINQFVDYIKNHYREANVAVIKLDRQNINSDSTAVSQQINRGQSLFYINGPEHEFQYALIADALPVSDNQQIQDLCTKFQSLLYIVWPMIHKNEPELADLMSYITHDINSLLTIGREQSSNSEEFLFKMSYIEKANTDLLFYLRELDLSMIEVGIAELMQAMISEIPDHKNVNVQTIFKAKECFIRIDMEYLNLAFQNLVSNAIRAARLKGNDLVIKTDMSKGTTDPWVEISVIDNGPGIPVEFLDRILKPFFTTYKSQGHSGFGLAIADKIIRAHRGTLKIKNRPTAGIKALIRLPAVS